MKRQLEYGGWHSYLNQDLRKNQRCEDYRIMIQRNKSDGIKKQFESAQPPLSEPEIKLPPEYAELRNMLRMLSFECSLKFSDAPLKWWANMKFMRQSDGRHDNGGAKNVLYHITKRNMLPKFVQCLRNLYDGADIRELGERLRNKHGYERTSLSVWGAIQDGGHLIFNVSRYAQNDTSATVLALFGPPTYEELLDLNVGIVIQMYLCGACNSDRMRNLIARKRMRKQLLSELMIWYNYVMRNSNRPHIVAVKRYYAEEIQPWGLLVLNTIDDNDDDHLFTVLTALEPEIDQFTARQSYKAWSWFAGPRSAECLGVPMKKMRRQTRIVMKALPKSVDTIGYYYVADFVVLLRLSAENEKLSYSWFQCPRRRRNLLESLGNYMPNYRKKPVNPLAFGPNDPMMMSIMQNRDMYLFSETKRSGLLSEYEPYFLKPALQPKWLGIYAARMRFMLPLPDRILVCIKSHRKAQRSAIANGDGNFNRYPDLLEQLQLEIPPLTEKQSLPGSCIPLIEGTVCLLWISLMMHLDFLAIFEGRHEYDEKDDETWLANLNGVWLQDLLHIYDVVTPVVMDTPEALLCWCKFLYKPSLLAPGWLLDCAYGSLTKLDPHGGWAIRRFTTGNTWRIYDELDVPKQILTTSSKAHYGRLLDRSRWLTFILCLSIEPDDQAKRCFVMPKELVNCILAMYLCTFIRFRQRYLSLSSGVYDHIQNEIAESDK